ncbi:porin family protein [Myxococcota bacterium]|nr:porin family protein [Myxococcota bacterium]MBU1537851.1 porin family protein [Myxococcota bacterium]
MKKLSILPLALLIFASVSHAQAPVSAPGPVVAPVVQQRADLPTLSITISPLLLILPIFEVTAEMRINPQMGVALIVGGGKVTVEEALREDYTVTVYEIGAQYKYYVLGNFKSGLHLGAEMMFLKASGDVNGTSAVAGGLSMGAFVGYKHTFSFGLTLEAQLGGQYYAVRAEAEDTNDTAEDSDLAFLLNLNIGYSF